MTTPLQTLVLDVAGFIDQHTALRDAGRDVQTSARDIRRRVVKLDAVAGRVL